MGSDGKNKTLEKIFQRMKECQRGTLTFFRRSSLLLHAMTLDTDNFIKNLMMLQLVNAIAIESSWKK